MPSRGCEALLRQRPENGSFSFEVRGSLKAWNDVLAAMLSEFCTTWLVPGGWAVVGIDHYREHEASLAWPEQVGVHMTTMSEEEWLQAWAAAGFSGITSWRAAGDPGTLVIAGQAPLA